MLSEENGKIKILLVIPLFNNAGTIKELAVEVLEQGYSVLIVNDGSTDNGPEIVKELCLTLINHSVNRGKGAAIKTAAEWAEENHFTHIITIDADGQHLPSEISIFTEKIKENPLSIIVGNRDFEKAGAPEASRVGRENSNLWFKLATGSSLPDTQSGFRAYPVEAIRKIKCLAERYNYEIEIIVRGAWAGLPVVPVNISVKYNEETKKASHFRPFMDSLRCSKTFALLILRNLLPWPNKLLFGPSRSKTIKNAFRNPRALVKMLFTESTSPSEIILACMAGILLGTLPLIGLHLVAIAFVSTRLHLNRLIALNISHICAPPFVPALCIEVGYYLRHGEFLYDLNWQTLGREFMNRFGDYLLGATVFAPVFAVFTGLVIFIILSSSKLSRKLKNG
ncbi:MAG: hypothetical protein A2017_02700 [Lentisphaerae bacterium GWF2_44_16]|nr:MAG: hypothetical protein A2017_02700 [Lentisphaerae bacterium GWF2_44_16]